MSSVMPFGRYTWRLDSLPSIDRTNTAWVGSVVKRSRSMQKSLPTWPTLSDRPQISRRIRTTAECELAGAIIYDSDFLIRVVEYANRHFLTVLHENQLGQGTDGQVWQTSQESAVKVFHREATYAMERDCYLRLQELDLDIIAGFHVPRLQGYDDELWIVEMSIVSPPFLLDFGKVYLDNPPDFSPEVMEDDDEYRRELFDDRWEEVQSLLWQLERIGIYYVDARPGNIVFGP